MLRHGGAPCGLFGLLTGTQNSKPVARYIAKATGFFWTTCNQWAVSARIRITLFRFHSRLLSALPRLRCSSTLSYDFKPPFQWRVIGRITCGHSKPAGLDHPPHARIQQLHVRRRQRKVDLL